MPSPANKRCNHGRKCIVRTSQQKNYGLGETPIQIQLTGVIFDSTGVLHRCKKPTLENQKMKSFLIDLAHAAIFAAVIGLPFVLYFWGM